MNSFYFLIFLGLCSSSLSISENPSSESILYIRFGEEMFSVNLYDSPRINKFTSFKIKSNK